MLIPIHCDDTGVQEWALIEMQGKIEVQGDLNVQEDSLAVGTMQLSKTNEAVVQLQIGYHVLEGKRVPLKKPLAILQKQKQAQQEGSSAGCSLDCKVIGVLRHKYLFKIRPRALISKPGARSKQ